MKQGITVEICLDSVESCMAAERGGAHRVELCADLEAGGTTPSAGMIAAARERISLALHVMIRPRRGDFCYADTEYEVMQKDVVVAKQLGANGVVFGMLTRAGQIDVDRTRALADLARPMSVTFHRAFDMTKDPFLSLEQLVKSGVERVLTSGQATSARTGLELIGKLVKQGKGCIAIMPGGGVTAGNVKAIVDGTGVREIHIGTAVYDPASSPDPGGLFSSGSNRTVNSGKVARILEVLREI